MNTRTKGPLSQVKKLEFILQNTYNKRLQDIVKLLQEVVRFKRFKKILVCINNLKTGNKKDKYVEKSENQTIIPSM